ncbi:SURF1 family protein [Propionibacteriaceae bacterium Y2011]
MRPVLVRILSLVAFGCVLAVVFVNLGQWQLRRLDERQARNAAVVAAEAAPVADWHDYFTRPLTEADEWHRVRISGTYDPEHQYVVRFRHNGDVRGYEVVTPLRTDDGTVVLVNRGFAPVPSGEQMPTSAPPPPAGQVELIGMVRLDERGGPGAEDPNQGQVRVINSEKIGAALGEPVASGWLHLLESDPAQDSTLAPAEGAKLDEGPHLSYAVQWFLFTLVGVIGIIVFIRTELKDRRKQRDRRVKQDSRAG